MRGYSFLLWHCRGPVFYVKKIVAWAIARPEGEKKKSHALPPFPPSNKKLKVYVNFLSKWELTGTVFIVGFASWLYAGRRGGTPNDKVCFGLIIYQGYEDFSLGIRKKKKVGGVKKRAAVKHVHLLSAGMR